MRIASGNAVPSREVCRNGHALTFKNDKYMKPKQLVLCAVVLAFVGHSVAATINSVPTTISSPGTYQVTKDLICPANVTAITINSPKAGKIVLDLGGFTLSDTASASSPAGVYILNPTNSPILVKNGRVNSFATGIDVNSASVATTWVTNIQIENVTFGGDYYAGVSFYQANGCSATSCSFGGGEATYGIKDSASETGNKFLDNTFDGEQFTILSIGGGLVATKVIDYRASPGPTP